MDNKRPTCEKTLNKKKKEQTYKYKREESIVLNFDDDYELSQEEYYLLYSFFVTYSMCGNQSGKKKNFVDYGWQNINLKNSPLETELQKIINLKEKQFVFTDKDNLKEEFKNNNLTDGKLSDYTTERCVIAKTNENNKYLKLFYRVRDGLAHGKFYLKKEQDEKIVIIQDDNTHNVTARIVIKLQTLLNIIKIVDKNSILEDKRRTLKDNEFVYRFGENLKKDVG